MPPVIKKPCVNNNNFSYSGKECSPLGKGYTADAEQVGTIMEGRDTTMWMVGIKNGVKVWNRVPTDLANETVNIANDNKEEKENKPSPKKEKAAPAKKAPAVKKKPVVEVSESESDDESSVKASDKTDQSSDEEKAAKSPKKEPVKKKAPSKKKEPKNEDNDESSTPKKTPVEKEKKTRKPTDFNYFMSYQMKIVSEENPTMSHKEKFSKVASLWKELSEDEKKAVLIKAKADK